MRLFAAIWLPDEVRLALAARLRALAHTTWPRLRWADPATWHVTLAFFGDLPDDVATDLSERLGRVAHRHRAVPLSLGAVGAFGRPAAARVVTTKVDDGSDGGLRALAASVAAAGRRCGARVEERRYRPHVTLARSRVPFDARPLIEALGRVGDGLSWTVDEFALVRSHLRPVVRYETLASWRLR